MVRYIEVENRKGKILRGFLNLPDGVAHPPVVLNLHGFGGSLSGYKYAHTHLARTLEAEESHVCDLISTDVGKVTESLMR